jgi:hypothetical protein
VTVLPSLNPIVANSCLQSGQRESTASAARKQSRWNAPEQSRQEAGASEESITGCVQTGQSAASIALFRNCDPTRKKPTCDNLLCPTWGKITWTKMTTDLHGKDDDNYDARDKVKVKMEIMQTTNAIDFEVKFEICCLFKSEISLKSISSAQSLKA